MAAPSTGRVEQVIKVAVEEKKTGEKTREGGARSERRN